MFSIVEGDLFTAGAEFALAHCISGDFALGAGIAKEFARRFGTKDELRTKYKQSSIPNCILTRSSVLNLVTKPQYWNKPTMDTLRGALIKMCRVCEKCNIHNVAMPMIGCGLDQLPWSEVKSLLESMFANSDLNVVVYIPPNQKI